MFKVCVVEKVCGFVVCGFLFVFVVFLEREKSEGGCSKFSLSEPSHRIRFVFAQKNPKKRI